MVTTRSNKKSTTPVPGDAPTTASRKTRARTSSPLPRAGRAWAHAPSRLTLLWMAVSLPLVIWDSGYVLMRPLTMEGGSLHWPVWAPYKLYGEVDHVYGWKSFEARNGFTSAQGSLNVVETGMYLVYVWLWWARGREAQVPVVGEGEEEEGGEVVTRRTLTGRPAALAVVLAFSAAVMTLSKTVLYCEFDASLLFCVPRGTTMVTDTLRAGLNEYFSGFDNIGHNSIQDLIFLWIIPK